MKLNSSNSKNDIKKKSKSIVELAKEKNQIQSYKEAFIKYPVQNEYHKGKVS